MSDKYYCDECHAIVDPAQHARSINIKPASGHPDAVKVDSGLYAAICAEQREKDAQIAKRYMDEPRNSIHQDVAGRTAGYIYGDIRSGKEE